MLERPKGLGLVEWHLFLRHILLNRTDGSGNGLAFMATQIVAAIEDERERCARLHEMVDPASDDERSRGVPGSGAMGAVIQYRDLIRAQKR